MWICDGPGKGHHSSIFFQHDLVRNVLGTILEKSEAKRKTLSGICGFVMVLARIIIFPIVPNMVWEGIVLGTILEKSEAKRKTLSGICGVVMVLARITIFQIVPNMVWEGIVLGTIFEKVKPRAKPYQGSSFFQLFQYQRYSQIPRICSNIKECTPSVL